MNTSLFAQSRAVFHKSLVSDLIRTNKDGVPNFADNSQAFSRKVAKRVLYLLEGEKQIGKISGQTLGHQFEALVRKYLESTFFNLHHLRPGKWEIEQIKGRSTLAIAQYEQYTHLIDLKKLSDANQVLASALGNDYSISPDIVVLRMPESDDVINVDDKLVDEKVSQQSVLRLVSNSHPILHASISCKWTLRSDRAQNARSEALNLIRNRKGRSPHIVIVTAEPTPSRISSIALGTGDVDCVYHFALYELEEAIKEVGNEDNLHLLKIMKEGKRLKDISDLPLDLAV